MKHLLMSPFALVLPLSALLLTAPLLGQPASSSTPSSGTFVDRVFHLQLRDPADIDGDIVSIEVIDRTMPGKSRVIRSRVELGAAFSEPIEIVLAQPVDATIVITAIQDSDNPEHRGLSGISMSYRLVDTLEGLVWETDLQQFANTAKLNIQLDAVAQPAKSLADWIASDARNSEGSERYARNAELSHFGVTFPIGSNKCNLFVHDILFGVGIKPPTWIKPISVDGHAQVLPLLAGDWADRTRTIEGFTVEETPKIGDIVAAALPPEAGASGHVGIIVEVESSGFGNRVMVASVSSVTGKVVIKSLVETFPPGSGYGKPVLRRALPSQ